MLNNVSLAKLHAKAFHARDENTIRKILHPDYRFFGPNLSLTGPDESVQFMHSMPMVANVTNSRYIAQENLVTHAFDLAFKQPFEGIVRMCEILTIKDSRILKIELFYDSADIPSAPIAK